MTPIEVFQAASQALVSKQWEAVADLCDGESLARFKAELVRDYSPDRKRESHGLTAEFYLKHDPKLPGAVAEYYAERSSVLEDVGESLRRDLPAIGSYDELVSMDPALVFARWLWGMSVAFQVEREIEAGRIPPEHAHAARAASGFEYAFTPIGEVAEGYSLCHVLYRRTMGPNELAAAAETLGEEFESDPALTRQLTTGHPMIAPLRRQLDGSWKLLTSRPFLGQTSFVGWASDDDVVAEGEGNPD